MSGYNGDVIPDIEWDAGLDQDWEEAREGADPHCNRYLDGPEWDYDTDLGDHE